MALPVFLALRITGSVFFVVKGHVIHSQAEIYLAIVVCQVLAFFFFFSFCGRRARYNYVCKTELKIVV